MVLYIAFSALTLLVGRQEGHPACKNWVMGCWRGYLSWARCRLAYGPADATATHHLLLQYNPEFVLPFWYRLTRVVPDRAIKCVCVCGAFYYSSADPIDGARGIMFWGCLSGCMCDVLICLTRQRHPQPSLLSTSSIQPSYCISYFRCNNTANAAACNVLLSSPGVVCR